MHPVTGGKLAQQVRDVAFDGFDRNGQLVGDLFIGQPPPSQAQHLNFAVCQLVCRERTSAFETADVKGKRTCAPPVL